MALSLRDGASSLVLRKEAFDRAGLSRAAIDAALALTDEEFRVERDLVVIGPLYDVEGLASLVDALERAGLAFYEDFFELSGNWPNWLTLFVQSRSGQA